jgi:predicted nucleic acid-binding protein
MAAILVDTNILIYAHDPSDRVKQDRAIDVLDRLHAAGIGRVSSQTLAEFFAATTRGRHPLLSVSKAARQVENIAHSWIIFDITPFIVLEATRGVRVHKFSYRDSQLWATARLNQAAAIVTEDFNAGSTVEGVHFINPFAATFDLSAWV